MRTARYAVIVSGIVLPTLVGLISMGLGGMDGTGSMGTMLSLVLIGTVANSVCWGGVLLATLAYRNPKSVFFPAVAGIVPLAVVYAGLGGESDPLLVIGLIIVPFYTLPLILLGALGGLWFDRRSNREAPPK